MQKLTYPFSSEEIIKKKRSIRRRLLEDEAVNKSRIQKRIAVLGGSTTRNIVEMLELFLLDAGIQPDFYESEYNRYYEDAIFPGKELSDFQPDIIFIHTTTRNITRFPAATDSDDAVTHLMNEQIEKFYGIWKSLEEKFGCIIIQNNFELPSYRLYGNLDFSDVRGKVHFVNELNDRVSDYASAHSNFFVNDINYHSARYGLDKWQDPYAWYMYKYACAIPAILELALNIASIIKAIYGLSKKVLVCDLDNTLWGGVIAEDGEENIEIGQGTAIAENYTEIQEYIREKMSRGVLLAVDSKNDNETARKGLQWPDSILKEGDFASFHANWDRKDQNIQSIASDLNLGLDSMVFIDDNPAEREIVRGSLPGVAVPEIPSQIQCIQTLEKNGYFETAQVSKDDLERNEMYRANQGRKALEGQFSNYEDYLASL